MEKPGSLTLIQEQSDVQGSQTEQVCAQCDPVHSCHVTEFKNMVHTGSELKKSLTQSVLGLCNIET